jgi:hypothetical protein
MRELIYISLLAGFCSGLAAALDRGLFALLFAAAFHGLHRLSAAGLNTWGA